MRSFIALIWNEYDPVASHRAASFQRAISDEVSPDASRIRQAGFAIYDLSAPAHQYPFINFATDSAGEPGAIFGTLFRKSGGVHAGAPIAAVDAASAATLRASGARSLLADFWGRYVAFLNTHEGFAVLPDPAASIPCYFTEQSGVHVIFSNLEKCGFLDRSGFSINYAFISALLAYDKIQNGDTGLNQIGELLGGQRLLITRNGSRIDRLWDPRKIALNSLDVSREEAAHLLRQAAGQAVGTWASTYNDVAVSLSGGLDSSIVLNALAHSGYGGRLSAVHFRPQSGDGSELHYARAAAEHAGCDLLDIPVAPDTGLPCVDDHPLTVRPNRQFLAPDLPGLLPPLPGSGRRPVYGPGRRSPVSGCACADRFCRLCHSTGPDARGGRRSFWNRPGSPASPSGQSCATRFRLSLEALIRAQPRRAWAGAVRS